MPVERSLVVPLRGGLEQSTFPQVRLENVHVDLEAQARTVRHGNVSLIDDRVVRLARPSDPVEEGLVVGLVILARQELIAGGGGMRAGKQRDRAIVIVDAGCDSV